jgi:O-methyltransferase domain
LVYVGDGSRGTTGVISKAFPYMKCTVLDLPHVVRDLKSEGNVEILSGDMFDFIPR